MSHKPFLDEGSWVWETKGCLSSLSPRFSCDHQKMKLWVPRDSVSLALYSAVKCMLSGVQIKFTLLCLPVWFSSTQGLLPLRAGWLPGCGWQMAGDLSLNLCEHSLRYCGVLTHFVAFLRSEVGDAWCHPITVPSLLWESWRGIKTGVPNTCRIIKNVISKQRFRPGLFRCLWLVLPPIPNPITWSSSVWLDNPLIVGNPIS